MVVSTALEADDTSAWQTRQQAGEDGVSGGLGVGASSKVELGNVLEATWGFVL